MTRRLIQITDLHLREQPGDILCSDVVTDFSLRQVLDEILACEGPDSLLVVTGDLVQDPVESAYLRLNRTLAEYPFRFACVPGNHDDSSLMRQCLTAPRQVAGGHLQHGGWRILLLDSSAPGVPQGRLGAQQLETLREQIRKAEEPHLLLALHHHPVAVLSPWMDRMGLLDSARLFEVIGGNDRVRGLLFGHVHQEIDVEHRGVRCLGTPSTCVQFAPRTLTMSLDNQPPAYRWLDLHDDGRIETGVRYLAREQWPKSA